MVFKFATKMELDEYIGFSIDDRYYCINIEYVQEIIYVPVISKIPNAPPFIEGAINLRGKIVRVFNLRKWFRLPWKSIDKDTKIIIIDLEEKQFGLLVDKVYEVINCEKKDKHGIPFLLAQQSEISYAKSVIIENDHLFVELLPDIFLEE